jgi:pimeloyl-ACP methyl ester carboxylesterase
LWIEEGVSNVVTVLDAVGSERAAAVSELIGVTVGIGLAATHPDRVAALVLVDPLVRVLWAEDYPWGWSVATREMFADSVRAGWGEGVLAGSNPSLRHDPEAHRWLARWERASVPRGHAYAGEGTWTTTCVRCCRRSKRRR